MLGGLIPWAPPLSLGLTDNVQQVTTIYNLSLAVRFITYLQPLSRKNMFFAIYIPAVYCIHWYQYSRSEDGHLGMLEKRETAFQQSTCFYHRIPFARYLYEKLKMRNVKLEIEIKDVNDLTKFSYENMSRGPHGRDNW